MSESASDFALCWVKLPLTVVVAVVIGCWITGADSTSPSSVNAVCLPTLLVV